MNLVWVKPHSTQQKFFSPSCYVPACLMSMCLDGCACECVCENMCVGGCLMGPSRTQPYIQTHTYLHTYIHTYIHSMCVCVCEVLHTYISKTFYSPWGPLTQGAFIRFLLVIYVRTRIGRPKGDSTAAELYTLTQWSALLKALTHAQAVPQHNGRRHQSSNRSFVQRRHCHALYACPASTAVIVGYIYLLRVTLWSLDGWPIGMVEEEVTMSKIYL